MSKLKSLQLEAWEKAYWYFAGMDYINDDCDKLAEQFAEYAVENMADGLTLDDLLNDFVGDVVFADRAEADKERGMYV